jgi:RES domain-containing protein
MVQPRLLTPHPDRHRFADRLQSFVADGGSSLSATVFRFINPKFSKPEDVVSGGGGLVANGRWHCKGNFRISYTSLSPETALAESLAHVRYYNLPEKSALPKVLVSLSADLKNVLLLTDGKLRQKLKFSEAAMKTTDWRADNRRGAESLTQAWGWAIQQAGFDGLLVPSAAGSGQNLLIYQENLTGGAVRIDNDIVWPS